ncbi:single-stranded-DNA-specific exonuclease RecJ [Desulfofarcimen acetoxidans DSM 771]|uniref:Single-stranded-DNA-specific exonuclease RecJ n=1 Tax=Desulfofarcimen acetoxidans (strain ATCC 49208 / DSM 771 / KCTC 5769 / VKM B-1644 / 5575) TaxID=485916 RepID=C8VZX5_DESAS|nr:single-stranded-DNA-specific exonuclease RecJ [Desulfofarcimen acetoxidans]ACV63103.1 single-stranded-DNA-specific exonuclease RecJ [Desulfofarcimen acetoxidans DSM 771]
MQKQKIWHIKENDLATQSIITKELGVSPILAQLMVNRGLGTVEQIKNFMEYDLSSLNNPYILQDMQKAVNRIIEAVNRSEKILIYGDYDVDGITGTALLVGALRRLTDHVNYYIPHRIKEGYGLHKEAVEKAAGQGYSLIITVDCGISGKEAVDWSVQNTKTDIIITDHHEPPPVLPAALAVINPKRKDCEYPFKELAGIGVALKLVQAVYAAANMSSETWKEYLDIVCLGTIADVVPLLGENRILVKYGLPYLTKTSKKGLIALIKASGLRGDITSGQVGFVLAPRLNAAGRLGDPFMAVELLLTEDEAQANQIAVVLDEKNRKRKSVEDAALKEAIQMIEREISFKQSKVLVLASEEWHPGVIGLVASRLVERYYKPVLAIALDGEQGKGSARSIPGFNLYQALEHCGKNLSGYGGHTMAAGFSLKRESLDNFIREINVYADEVISEDLLVPVMNLDGIFSLNDITEQVIAEIEKLAPFGQANPGPLLCCPEIQVVNFKGVGKEGEHLKIKIRKENGFIDGIGFNLASYSEMLATAERVNLAFVPEINEWQGKRHISLRIKDIQADTNIYRDSTGSQSINFTLAQEANCSTKNTYLMFQPEYILQEIIEYNTSNQIFLPDLSGRLIFPDANLQISLSPDTIITDKRNSSERINRLLATEFAKLTLIMVGCGYQTVELSRFLMKSRPDLKNRVRFLHLSMREEEINMVINDLYAGKILVLVTTLQSASGLKLSDLNKIMLFHLPFTRKEWGLLCYLLKNIAVSVQLDLVFGRHDRGINQQRLDSVMPFRNNLANLFSYLRQVITKAGKPTIELNLAAIVNNLNNNKLVRLSNFMIQLGMNVFKEIGLLEYQREGSNYQVKLLPTPKEKFNLPESVTYNRWQNIWEETKLFSQLLLKTPSEDFYYKL